MFADTYPSKSCLRCSRARRSCPGYNTNKDLKFVNYSGEVTQPTQSLLEITTAVPSESPLGSVDWLEFEAYARQQFFDDYRVYSPDQAVSRGYLNGLPDMISKAGLNSDVTKACTTIALASLGKKVSDQSIFERAQRMHTLLLRSFSLSISSGDTFVSVESLITATLLGLYEVNPAPQTSTLGSHYLTSSDYYQNRLLQWRSHCPCSRSLRDTHQQILSVRSCLRRQTVEGPRYRPNQRLGTFQAPKLATYSP